MKSIYWFSFFVPPRDDERTLFWHQLRDGEGFAYLREAIARAGIAASFGGIIRNVPRAPSPDRFSPNDLLVATTRFPLDDDIEDRRTVVQGDNRLEQRLGIPRSESPQGAACRFFHRLNRSFAVLQPGLAEMLPDDAMNRFDIQFSTGRGARCLKYDRRPNPSDWRRTAAYLIHIPRAWPNGPGLIWSFGLSGETGLIWNKLVNDELVETLHSPCFVMAEFDIPEPLLEPKSRDLGPGDFDAMTAESLNLKYLIRETLTETMLTSLGF